jgi:membrane protease YdiL (CAAX protease family)
MIMSIMTTEKEYIGEWRAFAVLLILGGAAVVVSFPLPPPVAPVAGGVMALAAVIALGLLMGRGAGLGAPVFSGRAAGGGRAGRIIRPLLMGAAAGLILGTAMLVWLRVSPAGADASIQSRFQAESIMPVWKRGLLSFDAAVLEEIVFRLFFVTLLVWLLGRRWLFSRHWPFARRAWTAVAVVAVGFGLAHLPKWMASTPVTPALIISIVILNGIGGLILGIVYWKMGIEAAITGHFAADVVLHVLGPPLF